MYRNPPLDTGKYAMSIPINSNGRFVSIGLNRPLCIGALVFIFKDNSQELTYSLMSFNVMGQKNPFRKVS